MMNNNIDEKKKDTVGVLRLVEKTVIEITGWYWDSEGLRCPIVKRTTVLVPEKEA